MGAADSPKVLAVFGLLTKHFRFGDVAYDFGDGRRPAVRITAFSDWRVYRLARPERVRAWPHGDRWWFEIERRTDDEDERFDVERWADDEDDDYVVYWPARFLWDADHALPQVQVAARLIAAAIAVTETRNRGIWLLEDFDSDDKREAGRVLDRRIAELRTQYGKLYERWSAEGPDRPWLPTAYLPK